MTNTGDVAGKDVVQLYYSAPYIKGGIEKSAVNLGAFAKTDLLKPGDSQEVQLTMTFDDMASFDYSNAQSYVMDAGTYTFTLRTDAHTIKNNASTFTYDLDNTIVYDDDHDGKRSTDEIAAVSQQEFADAGSMETNMHYLSRADFSGTFPNQERRLNPTSIPTAVKARLEPMALDLLLWKTHKKILRCPPPVQKMD
ncbi:fibronectin type III-like domain-contianing protein [Bifidobacterium tsurumiense]|uniref:fibronectin type III-like domain-contianing protein n=1 Tax=Bifidobacterium tsurumiense TaxID=356829 RepID=UPI000AAE4C18|nr:fibronectin type III-like domain-contianing protein [Bifidobacterium tsurumiense]